MGKSTVSMHVSRRRVVFALVVAAAEQGASAVIQRSKVPTAPANGLRCSCFAKIKLVILASVLRRSSWLLVN